MNPSRISRQSDDALRPGIKLLSAWKPGTLPQCRNRSSPVTVHGETSKYRAFCLLSFAHRSARLRPCPLGCEFPSGLSLSIEDGPNGVHGRGLNLRSYERDFFYASKGLGLASVAHSKPECSHYLASYCNSATSCLHPGGVESVNIGVVDENHLVFISCSDCYVQGYCHDPLRKLRF
jgi:hypothetical protein